MAVDNRVCVILTRRNKLPPGEDPLIITWVDDATPGGRQVGNYNSWPLSGLNQEHRTHILG